MPKTEDDAVPSTRPLLRHHLSFTDFTFYAPRLSSLCNEDKGRTHTHKKEIKGEISSFLKKNKIKGEERS